MGKTIQIKPGFDAVTLPDGKRYRAGDSVTLTDAEYAALAAADSRAITLTNGSAAEPTRSPINVAISLADALSQSKAYADTKLQNGTGAPTIAGAVGDFYFRKDTPTTTNQRIYVCSVAGVAGSATWIGIV